MQIPGCGRDAGMTHEALDDVDIHAPAHEARGVAVTPPVRVMSTGHACQRPGLEDQVVQCPSPVADRKIPVASGLANR